MLLSHQQGFGGPLLIVGKLVDKSAGILVEAIAQVDG
jgi:hypothetical protein